MYLILKDMTTFLRNKNIFLVWVCIFSIGFIFMDRIAHASCGSTTGLPGQENGGGGDGYYVYCKQGDAYPGISYRPGDSSINGYSGEAIASYNNGQTYVQLKSGQWVNAQQYSPALDNPPPPPPQNSGSSEPIGETLCLISKSLQGPIGKSVATIAVVVLGIGLFLGKLSWPLAVATAIGIGLIFGASEMVSWISPQSGSGC